MAKKNEIKRTRTTPKEQTKNEEIGAQENVTVKDEQTSAVPKGLKWKVKSGGITLLRDRNVTYNKGDVFFAEENEIPESFRDIVTCLTEVVGSVAEKRKRLVYSKEEIVASAEEQDESGFIQKYNIVSSTGKIITPDVTEEEANELLTELNQ